MDRYDVVWDSPSEDSSGSMPLGNGDIGLNLWVEPNGDLVFYISKTDAWSENARLLKLGRVRVRLDPSPFAAGEQFEQRLHLRAGEVTVTGGPEGNRALLRVWVDAHNPAIRVEAETDQPTRLSVALETWRTKPRELKGREMFSAYGLGGAPHPVIVQPDKVLEGQRDRIAWYHRNAGGIWREAMLVQGMEQWADGATDPLADRTFGGIILGPGLTSSDDSSLASAEQGKTHTASIFVHTAQTPTAGQWLAELEQIVSRAEATSLQELRDEHRAWWGEFWSRSWVHLSGTSPASSMTANELPLRFGADSDGSNRFRGHISRARVYGQALTDKQVAQLAQAQDAEPPDSAGLIGDWRFDALTGGQVRNLAQDALHARAMGEVDTSEAGGITALRLAGDGWVEVPDDPALHLTDAITLEAWVRPEQLPQGGGRIIDKSKAGTSNGYLLDTYPGNSLRLILEPRTLSHDARLPAGEWSHVAASYDANTGDEKLYVNGQLVAQAQLSTGTEQISQGYALQRYMSACAGRGAYPIKFNGSIFTVDATDDGEQFDADYRRWGGPYWFQNTRLPYWPMLASGDREMMLPLFRMYMDALPFAKQRTRAYFNHEGAFFPETMYFWGGYATENYGWNREGKHPSDVDNTYIRYYYSGALELAALMLGYYEHAGDDEFAREMLVPFATEIIAFYDQHYSRDDAGRLTIKPSQALETWQQAINPLPPIAGLKYVLDGLLELPGAVRDAAPTGDWQRLLGELPELPMQGEGDGAMLSPAGEILEEARNSENPELYAIFPYTLYGVGKPDLDVARRAFEARRVKGSHGWQQDDTQAALLGLAQEAARLLSARMAQKNPGSRFPAFWGPNFDWVPDQDHGTNALMALQTMLMQTDGERILLLPAWPKQWNVQFRLQAPKDTTVTGEYRDGELRSLEVTPESRRADVQVIAPQ